jgi:hypothetical protein
MKNLAKKSYRVLQKNYEKISSRKDFIEVFI